MNVLPPVSNLCWCEGLIRCPHNFTSEDELWKGTEKSVDEILGNLNSETIKLELTKDIDDAGNEPSIVNKSDTITVPDTNKNKVRTASPVSLYIHHLF
jgi:hypothetical protein